MDKEILDTHEYYPEATIYESHECDYFDCPSCGERFSAVYEDVEESESIFSNFWTIVILALIVLGIGRFVDFIIYAVRYILQWQT